MKDAGIKQGTSLIELMLYISIAGTVLLVSGNFVFALYQTRTRSQAIAEVEQQGMQISAILSQTIRNATGITSPTYGTSNASLTVSVPVAANSPTVFDVVGTNVRISEGTAAPVQLNSNRVAVSNVSFKNISTSSIPGTVKFTFTLSHVNPSNKKELSYSQTFTSSATIR